MTSTARSTGPATHAAAVATAQARAVSLGLDLTRYRAEITEEENPAIYVVQLIAKDKPQGHRGALVALPEPVFNIENLPAPSSSSTSRAEPERCRASPDSRLPPPGFR